MDKSSFFDHFLNPDKRASQDASSFLDEIVRRSPQLDSENPGLIPQPRSIGIPDFSPPAPLQTPSAPPRPKQWTRRYLQGEIIRRIDARSRDVLDRLRTVVHGRTMPQLEGLPIGSARQFELVVMFIDICGFTKLPNSTPEDQKKVLVVLSMFTGEMMQISRDYTGVFEKNTGDGMMAYFGTDTRSPEESVKRATDAALVMYYVHHNHVNPWFLANGYPQINFRIAIDYGPVTIARIGAQRGLSALVAIGSTANTANRLMRLLPTGGIALGQHAAELLPQEWQAACTSLGPIADSFLPNGQPKYGWALGHRLTYPLR